MLHLCVLPPLPLQIAVDAASSGLPAAEAYAAAEAGDSSRGQKAARASQVGAAAWQAWRWHACAAPARASSRTGGTLPDVGCMELPLDRLHPLCVFVSPSLLAACQQVAAEERKVQFMVQRS
jgi:hypothetical protein